MARSAEVNSCDLDALRRIQEITVNSNEEIEIEFIKELNERERNFTESLKKSNDRIEGLLIETGPQVILRDYPDLSKVASTESRLDSLAQEFEKALEKAREGGWSRLVEPIKETAAWLRQLSEEEIANRAENIIHFNEKTGQCVTALESPESAQGTSLRPAADLSIDESRET